MNNQVARIGPSAIPHYPKKSWERANVDPVRVWEIVGPTVQNMIDNFPIWQICVSCYLEGLNHGSEAMREKIAGGFKP